MVKFLLNSSIEKRIDLYSGEDLSESKDHSIIRRTLIKGEGWAKPNDGASVEVTLKGTHDNKVFDERTVSFVVGEGFIQNIPEGFVYPIFHQFLSLMNFLFFSVEQAILKMTKGEHAQLKLKSKATTGVEKFNIPANTPVQYEVTLNSFEKVDDKQLSRIRSFLISLMFLGERNLVDE